MPDQSPKIPRISQRAQSMIEYSLITVLVMTGIFVMGPYLIRSVNSYFKFTEDSIEDSFQEDIKQADPTGEDFPACDCTPFQNPVCGDGVECGRREELWTKTCTPVGCQSPGFALVKCEDNPSSPSSTLNCCEDWVNTGICGVNASPPCPDGEVQRTRECGFPTINTETECLLDNLCVFTCSVTTLFDASWCLGDVTTGLLEDTDTTYVVSGGCTGVKCQAECDGSLFALPEPPATATSCGCPPAMEKVGTTCVCGTGSVWQGACSAGSCEASFGSCGPTECWGEPLPPPEPACPDGSCNGTEDCNSCPADCGVCPPPCNADGDPCSGSSECCSVCCDASASECIPDGFAPCMPP